MPYSRLNILSVSNSIFTIFNQAVLIVFFSPLILFNIYSNTSVIHMMRSSTLTSSSTTSRCLLYKVPTRLFRVGCASPCWDIKKSLRMYPVLHRDCEKCARITIITNGRFLPVILLNKILSIATIAVGIVKKKLVS